MSDSSLFNQPKCPHCKGAGEILSWGSTPAGRPIREVDDCPVCKPHSAAPLSVQVTQAEGSALPTRAPSAEGSAYCWDCASNVSKECLPDCLLSDREPTLEDAYAEGRKDQCEATHNFTLCLADVRGAVARGWCSPENSSKVMDAALALAIADEVWKLIGEWRQA